MANVNINLELDETVKKGMEAVCADIGLSMSTVFAIFAEKVAKEKRLPFEIDTDPFYSEANITYLERLISEYKAGNLKLTEHELIED